MMKRLSPVWKESLDLWAPVFKRSWSWLLFATLIGELSSLLADTLKKINEAYMPLGMAFTIVVQLLLSGFGVIIINQLIQDVMDKKPTELMKSLSENLKYVFIESARALMKMMLGFLLLVVPGLLATVRLYFVPYVAQFDPEYKAGKVDALERSESLIRGSFWPFSGILILTTLLSMVPEFWLGSIEIFHRPFLFVMVFFLSMVLELYTDIVLFCTYKKLHASLKENANGTSISLQGTSGA